MKQFCITFDVYRYHWSIYFIIDLITHTTFWTLFRWQWISFYGISINVSKCCNLQYEEFTFTFSPDDQKHNRLFSSSPSDQNRNWPSSFLRDDQNHIALFSFWQDGQMHSLLSSFLLNGQMRNHPELLRIGQNFVIAGQKHIVFESCPRGDVGKPLM